MSTAAFPAGKWPVTSRLSRGCRVQRFPTRAVVLVHYPTVIVVAPIRLPPPPPKHKNEEMCCVMALVLIFLPRFLFPLTLWCWFFLYHGVKVSFDSPISCPVYIFTSCRFFMSMCVWVAVLSSREGSIRPESSWGGAQLCGPTFFSGGSLDWVVVVLEQTVVFVVMVGSGRSRGRRWRWPVTIRFLYVKVQYICVIVSWWPGRVFNFILHFNFSG